MFVCLAHLDTFCREVGSGGRSTFLFVPWHAMGGCVGENEEEKYSIFCYSESAEACVVRRRLGRGGEEEGNRASDGGCKSMCLPVQKSVSGALLGRKA